MELLMLTTLSIKSSFTWAPEPFPAEQAEGHHEVVHDHVEGLLGQLPVVFLR